MLVYSRTRVFMVVSSPGSQVGGEPNSADWWPTSSSTYKSFSMHVPNKYGSIKHQTNGPLLPAVFNSKRLQSFTFINPNPENGVNETLVMKRNPILFFFYRYSLTVVRNEVLMENLQNNMSEFPFMICPFNTNACQCVQERDM